MELTEDEIKQKDAKEMWPFSSKHFSTIRIRIYLLFMWLQRN